METDTNLGTTLYALHADCRKSSDGSRWDLQQLVSTDDLDFDEVQRRTNSGTTSRAQSSSQDELLPAFVLRRDDLPTGWTR